MVALIIHVVTLASDGVGGGLGEDENFLFGGHHHVVSGFDESARTHDSFR